MGGLVRSAAACSYSYEPWAWGTTNFPASERRRSGVDGGFSPEPRVSSTCRLSASAQTRPPPSLSSPPPRASVHLDSASPLLCPPRASPPLFSGLLFCILFSLTARLPLGSSGPQGRR